MDVKLLVCPILPVGTASQRQIPLLPGQFQYVVLFAETGYWLQEKLVMIMTLFLETDAIPIAP